MECDLVLCMVRADWILDVPVAKADRFIGLWRRVTDLLMQDVGDQASVRKTFPKIRSRCQPGSPSMASRVRFYHTVESMAFPKPSVSQPRQNGCKGLSREEIRVQALSYQQAEDHLAEAVLIVRHHLHESNAHGFRPG